MQEETKQYNLRQLKLMEQKISGFLDDKIPIGWLCKDLYSLVKELKEPPKDFFLNFVIPLSWIEISYLDAMSENRDSFSQQELLLIHEGLEKIQDLIAKYKKEHLTNLDD